MEWVARKTGKMTDLKPLPGGRWNIKLEDEWIETKPRSPVNGIIHAGMVGTIVTVIFRHANNPLNRRVHEIESGMFPTITMGEEQE
jgi:hypothetical protein